MYAALFQKHCALEYNKGGKWVKCYLHVLCTCSGIAIKEHSEPLVCPNNVVIGLHHGLNALAPPQWLALRL